jgi:hypothetical protein
VLIAVKSPSYAFRFSPRYYEKLSDLRTRSRTLQNLLPDKHAKQIELDLHRTFPGNKHFQARAIFSLLTFSLTLDPQDAGRGITKLRRVLTAFVRHNPAVGYCQGFNFLGAFALLFLPEEMAFWCLVAIIDRIMPADYFVDPMIGPRADQRVLEELVREHLPQLAVAAEATGYDIAIVTFPWFFTMFVECVQPEITARIWDCLLLEGHDVLFRFAFALLSTNYSFLTQVRFGFPFS